MAPTLSQVPGSLTSPFAGSPGSARDPQAEPRGQAPGWRGARGCAACPARTPPRGRAVQSRQSGAACQGQAGDGRRHAALSGAPSVLAGSAAAPALCPARPPVPSSSIHPKSPEAKRTCPRDTGTPLRGTGDVQRQGTRAARAATAFNAPPSSPQARGRSRDSPSSPVSTAAAGQAGKGGFVQSEEERRGPR